MDHSTHPKTDVAGIRKETSRSWRPSTSSTCLFTRAERGNTRAPWPAAAALSPAAAGDVNLCLQPQSSPPHLPGAKCLHLGPRRPALIQPLWLHGHGLGCCGCFTIIGKSCETPVQQSQERTQVDTTGRGEMASHTSSRLHQKKKPLREGIKPSRSKQGGEIRKLSTIKDVPWCCRDQLLSSRGGACAASKGAECRTGW